MKTLLSAADISKSFRKVDGSLFTVLKKIDLTLRRGEIVCLLGPSGSGKTTLLQVLAGLETYDSGSITALADCPGSRLGYMTQSDRLLPWRNIRGNIRLGLDLLKQITDEKKIDDLIASVGLENCADRYPSQISGGMTQRALIARTLSTQPDILLLDEPMSNLDVLARRHLSAVLKKYIRENNAGAIVVTHSVEEAVFLADRIILITHSPAVLYREIAGEFTFDSIMRELLASLEGGRS